MNGNYILTICVIFVFFYGCSRKLTPSKEYLSWEENFNQNNSFDSLKWSKIPRGPSDWNRNMSDFDSCYALRNGNLILRGINNNYLPEDTARFLTGGIYTKDKMAFGYGRLEVRAKLQGAKGAWPAIWMLPEKRGKWPDGGEIDIMERLNFDSIAYQTVHSNFTVKLGIKDPKPGATGKIDPENFNTYAVEIYPDSLVFFINNLKTFTYPRIETDKEGQFPFRDKKYYLLIDMQLGGNWVGQVEPKDLPVEMEVDWVRFYEFRNTSLLKKIGK
ncbi:MAG: glycoside hydrolase family 16 protein [Ginsengibacter sp.]